LGARVAARDQLEDVGRSETGRGTGARSAGLPLLPPLSGLIELTVLTGLLICLDWGLPDFDLSDIQPNPFWLPVLLLSLQYGTVSGLIAAGVALLVTVFSGLPPEGVGENHFNYALRVYTQPILWFAAAVILGQFRMRQIAAKEALRRQVAELSQSRATLADYAASLRERCDRLERERAGARASPTVQLLERLLALAEQPGTLSATFDRLMQMAFPGASASVFALQDSRLVQVAAHNWGEAPRWQSEIGLAHPLYRSVIGDGASLSVLVPGDEHKLGGEGLVATPIRANGTSGPVIGLVKLEHADPTDLNEVTVRALAVVGMAAASRLMQSASVTVGDGHDAAPVEAAHGRLLRPLRWLPRKSEALPQAEGGSEASIKPKAVR
jgi:hypothetical protein